MRMSDQLSVLLIGAGSMGGSLLRAWLDKSLLASERSAIVDPALSEDLFRAAESCGIPVNPEHDQPYDICVLAVKPQMFPAVIPALSWPAMDRTLFVSIAAGKSVAAIRQQLMLTDGGKAPIIRVMPNLPVSIGQGISLLYADDTVSDDGCRVAERLMSAAGDVVWLPGEDQIDAGMSLSACGPAYVFLLVEAMTQAGVAAGLDQDIAAKLARQTVIGAGALMAADSRDAATLRQAVTSKGGTTAAALEVLDAADALRPIMQKAVEAATRRAGELAD